MQYDHVLKKLNFNLLRGEGGCRQNICYLVAAFTIGMQSDNILEKLNFDLLTQGSGDGGEQGSVVKIFATMLLHSCFPLM